MTPERALPADMDVDQVAALLDCTPRTVEDNARDGTLPALKFGVSWIFPTGALLSKLDQLATEQALARRVPARPSAVVRDVEKGENACRRRPLPSLPKLTANNTFGAQKP